MGHHATTRELEERLKLKESETGHLRKIIQKKDFELQELQDKCNFQSQERDDSERKYEIAYKEIIQLRGIVESRFPDEVEDGLLEKTHMYAEASQEVDKLQQKMKKAKLEREEWKKAMMDIQETNQQLSQKLHKAIAAYERLKFERNMNNKVFLELDDIVTVLNNIAIADDFPIEDENDNVCMKNIRRKIQAIDDERQKYATEGKHLREENGFKDAKINSLESKFYDANKRSVGRSSSSRQRRPAPWRLQGDDRSVSSSDSSTVEAPHISLEMYEETKAEYENTLQDMVQLTEELNATKASVKEHQQASVKKEERLNELSDEYKETLLEMSNLRRDHNKATANYDDVVLDITEMKEKYEQRLREMSESYSFLEENYNKLKDDQNEKLIFLESEVSNSERFFEEECKRLKSEHEVKIESIDREVDRLKKEHAEEIRREKRQYEDLRLEYESINDRQTKNTNELQRLKEKYDKSLKRIVQLEETLKREKETGEKTLMKFTEDAQTRYQNLKVDYNSLLAAKRSAVSSETNYIKNMESQYSALEEKHRRSKSEAEIQYRELRSSYDSSVATIGRLEKKLSEAQERAEHFEKNQNQPKSKYEIAFDEISNLERDLMSNTGTLSIIDEASSFDRFKDESRIEETKQNVNDTVKSESQFIGFEYIWYFLHHQRLLKTVLNDVQDRLSPESIEEKLPSSASSLFGSIFLENELDINDFKSEIVGEFDDSPKSKIVKMLDSLAKVKIHAITSQIQYQTREKELKVALKRFKKACEDIKSAKAAKKSQLSRYTSTGKSSHQDIPDSSQAVEKSDPPGEMVDGHEAQDETDSPDENANRPLHDESFSKTEMSRLNRLLKTSEERVDEARIEVEAAKKRSNEAQLEQDKQSTKFCGLLAEFKALEVTATHSNEHGVLSTLVPKYSFDDVSTMFASSASSSSGERRDEKLHSPKNSNKSFQNDMSGYIRLKQEHGLAMDRICALQNDLRERQTETDFAKQKLENREGDLKEVIQRYKDLHEEYKKFLIASDGSSAPTNSQAKLIQERDAARWRVSELEAELRQAEVSITSTLTKQNLAKQHLRDVIFQYKTLQREHEELVQRIEGLRIDLPKKSRCTQNLVCRSPSQEEKRDTSSPHAPIYLRPMAKVENQSYISARSGSTSHVNETQSVGSFVSSKTKSSNNKKAFYKEIYKEVKNNLGKSRPPPSSKGRKKKMVRIQGLS